MCSVPYGSPPQLRQAQFSLLCTKRQDQQFSGERDLICSLLPGWKIWTVSPEKFRFSKHSSLFVTCCLGGIITNVTKILRVLSWNFNSSISKREYFWQHHLLRWIASLHRKISCSFLLSPAFSFPQLFSCPALAVLFGPSQILDIQLKSWHLYTAGTFSHKKLSFSIRSVASD